MDAIPRKLHLTAKNRDVPLEYQAFYDRIISIHRGWEIQIYDDDDAQTFIEKNFSEYLSVYRSYRLNIQRTDMFRVAVVYLYGGFYLDLDMYCMKDLEPLLQYNLVVAEEKFLSEEENNILKHFHRSRIANYMFGSAPRHPFWEHVLSRMRNLAPRAILSENDVLETTGPGLLTNVFHELNHEYEGTVVLHNTEHICSKCKKPSCFFGDYAAHLHLGSWRWQ